MNWQLARCGAEMGVAWFRAYEADGYPRLHIGEAKWYQDEIVSAIQSLSYTTNDSEMSITAGALDEHWRKAEWTRQS